MLTICTLCMAQENEHRTETMYKLDRFESTEKFLANTQTSYPGIEDAGFRVLLSKKINQSARDFSSVYQLANPTNDDYLDALKRGLDSFSEIYLDLDTADRERICRYYEELMDIVGLESSNGLLMNFMYK